MAIFSTNHNALPTGYRLEDYQIQQVLGDGSFGITYLAMDTQLSTQVAIKEYFPNELAVRHGTIVQAKSPQDAENFAWGLDRFVEEAKTLAKFKHPNIVRVWRIFQTNQTAYIVMEYEQGHSLANLIKDGETATEEELLTLLPPLLDGLETVHKTGYLHRDLKPANIYLRDTDNRPVLIDFGAARYEVGSRSRTLTAIVTPGYAPFEQYESKGNSQGPWTDIYALGAVLYRLISGKTPIEATERIGAIMRNQPDPLTPAVERGREHYSSSLLEAIDWALQVKEGERPQTVAEWREKVLARPAELVAKSLVAKGKSADPPTTPTTSPKTSWKPAIIIMTWLCFIGVLVYYFTSTQPSKNTVQRNPLQDELTAKLLAANQALQALRKAEAEANAVAMARQQQERKAAQAKDADARKIQVAKEVEQARQKKLEEQTVINLVQDYYAALSRNDADSAIRMRKSVSNEQKLRSVIKGIEWFRVNEISLTEMGSGYATVQVNVTGKQKRGAAETWTGTIELEKNEWSEWKITNLNLTKED